MKFLNWMGIDAQDLERLPEEIGRDWPATLAFIGMCVIVIQILRSLPQ